MELEGPPSVVTESVNMASDQRSRVAELSFQFNNDVSASLDVTDLQVLNVTMGESVNVSDMAVSYDPERNMATWTFPGLAGETLSDGNYEATSTNLMDPDGEMLDGDEDGTPGGVYQFDFWRLFGDDNGNRIVDIADLFVFRGTYSLDSSHPNYRQSMDGDNNGTVGIADLFGFRSNYLAELPPQGGGGNQLRVPFGETSTRVFAGSESLFVEGFDRSDVTTAGSRPPDQLLAQGNQGIQLSARDRATIGALWDSLSDRNSPVRRFALPWIEHDEDDQDAVLSLYKNDEITLEKP